MALDNAILVLQGRHIAAAATDRLSWCRARFSSRRRFLQSEGATRPSWLRRIPCVRRVAPACSSTTETAVISEPIPSLVECLVVTGGYPLAGHVPLSGAKNSALAVLAGALCSEEELNLKRIPDLQDIRRMIQVLQSVGVRVRRSSSSGRIVVNASHITSCEPCPEAVRKLRASFFVIGALLGRKGEAVVPLPGGCNIGARPIDLHVRGLQALGAQVEIR